jgi:hypothetical protein
MKLDTVIKAVSNDQKRPDRMMVKIRQNKILEMKP